MQVVVEVEVGAVLLIQALAQEVLVEEVQVLLVLDHLQMRQMVRQTQVAEVEV